MSRDDKKRSGAMRLFEALSGVDQELLEKSEVKEKKGRITGWHFGRMHTAGTLAAAACVVVVGLAMWRMNPQSFMTKNATSEKATEAKTTAGGSAMDDGGTMDGGISNTSAGTAGEPQEVGAATDAGAAMMPDMEEATMDTATDTKEVGTPKDSGRVLTEAEAMEIAVLGEYVPVTIPAGYVWESARVYENEDTGEAEELSLTWLNGMDSINLFISVADASAVRLTDKEAKETYDVHLYEIPYGETVPEEYREVFNEPVFAEADFTLDIVEARMKVVSDQGDTDTPRGKFAVLYEDGVLVRFNGDGTAEEIWEMFQSME